MTREEAIAYGKRAIDLGLNDETQAFCELAIKALEQEPVIDKARAEIAGLQTYKMFIGEKTVYVERDDVLAVIDKHKEVRGNNADSN
jgi:hypothetical protein